MFIRRTNVCLTTKLSYEALNRQFFVGAVRCWRSVHRVCKPLSLLSCRVIECRLCVAFFLFFRSVGIFLIQFFICAVKVKALLQFLVFALACANCKCAYTCAMAFLSISIISFKRDDIFLQFEFKLIVLICILCSLYLKFKL